MAVTRQPLAIIRDENEMNRGKPSVAKSGGLKAQQPDLADRKTLSNITNKLKPLPNFGTATPIAPRKEKNVQNNGKGGFTVMADPEILGKSGVKARAGVVPRNPLSNITNVESLQNSSKVQAAAMKEKKTQTKNLRMGPNPNYEVTEEMKQKAEIWSREGIEKVNFTGKDMDALQEKMAEEEVNRRVAEALSYRTEFPYWHPRAFVKDPPEIKDHLEVLPEEDLYKKGGSFFNGMEHMVTHVDYDESYLECLEILENASKDWPTVVEQCVL